MVQLKLKIRDIRPRFNIRPLGEDAIIAWHMRWVLGTLSHLHPTLEHMIELSEVFL